jgi:hypothetical protein
MLRLAENRLDLEQKPGEWIDRYQPGGELEKVVLGVAVGI